MVTAVRPILRGTLGARSHLAWKRAAVLGIGGISAIVGAVGLMALRSLLFDATFMVPTGLGATLAFFGGMLGMATVLAPRGAEGLSEDSAIRHATQALAMGLYVVAPRLTLLGLGGTRLARAALPWTVARARWLSVAEGLALVLLTLIPREETLGGLLQLARVPA